MIGVRAADDQTGAIVASAAAGNEVAFAQLVALHHGRMRRVAFLVCHDVELAEDACQQAWQICWRRLATVRDPATVGAWLATIAANEARKLARRDRRRLVLERSVQPVAAMSDIDPGERQLVDLGRALGRLSPEDRELLALRYLAGFDATEIARARGRSASGIRARLARLLERLRKELADG